MTDAAVAPSSSTATDKRPPLPAGLDASTRAAVPAKIEPAAPVAGERTMVPWSAVFPSVHNPRKHFDPAKITSLAASIAVVGVMQNLTVRPDPKKAGTYEIAIGESRWRAVGELIAQGKADKSFALPVLIHSLTNIELIEIALTENMQRNDLTPIEEAEGLKALESKGLTTAEIAKRIGFSQRYVQQRLALAKNLSPEARAALEKGDIKVETARILVAAPQDRQAQILKEIGPSKYGAEGYDENPDDLRELVKDHQIPEKHAIFNIAQYKGAWLPGEKDGERFFADTVQFLNLQKAAIFVKRKALEEKGDAAWVKTGKFTSWNYDKKPGNKKAGVFIELADDGKVTVHKDLVDKPKPTYGTGHSSPAQKAEKAGPEADFAGDHLNHAVTRKVHLLQRCISENPVDAMRLVLSAYLGGWGQFAPLEPMSGNEGVDAGLVEDLKAQVAKLPAAARTGIVVGAQQIMTGQGGQVKRFQGLCEVSDAQISTLFARVIAAHFGSDGYGTFGDDDGLLALADLYEVTGKEEKYLALAAEDLETLGDTAIRAVARELKLEKWQLGAIATLKGDIAAAIKAGKAKTCVLPTLRFLKDPKKEIAAFTKGVDDAPAKADAKAEPKPKAKKKGKR